MEGSKNDSQLLLYMDNGVPQIEVSMHDGSVWLTQAQMATLFQTDRSSITKHIQNIYASGELAAESTCANFAQVQIEGGRRVSRSISYYNLDLIISLGYRVNSHIGTRFRQWATTRLNEYITKGFTMDDRRLAGDDSRYFDELVERVRKIRTSEKNFYSKIRDIFATSIDYEASSDTAQNFFATIQNKFHYAAHGHTAAELIVERSDCNQPNLGMTSWKGNHITIAEATIAKNYLLEDEMKTLELLSEQFLSYAELQSHSRKPFYMAQWVAKLHEFLEFNERPILKDYGSVYKSTMESHVKRQLAEHNKRVDAARSRQIAGESRKAKKAQPQLKGYKSTRKPKS